MPTDYTDILPLKTKYMGKLRELEIATENLADLYADVAEKECIYREAKAKGFLRQLADDQKVTVIGTIVAGETAKIRLEFKIADGILKSAKENLKRLHSNVEACRTLISIAKQEIAIR